jgi:hypothetical protein
MTMRQEDKEQLSEAVFDGIMRVVWTIGVFMFVFYLLFHTQFLMLAIGAALIVLPYVGAILVGLAALAAVLWLFWMFGIVNQLDQWGRQDPDAAPPSPEPNPDPTPPPPDPKAEERRRFREAEEAKHRDVMAALEQITRPGNR